MAIMISTKVGQKRHLVGLVQYTPESYRTYHVSNLVKIQCRDCYETGIHLRLYLNFIAIYFCTVQNL